MYVPTRNRSIPPKSRSWQYNCNIILARENWRQPMTLWFLTVYSFQDRRSIIIFSKIGCESLTACQSMTAILVRNFMFFCQFNFKIFIRKTANHKLTKNACFPSKEAVMCMECHHYRPRSRGDNTFGSVCPSVRLFVCSSQGAFKMVGRSKWLLFWQVYCYFWKWTWH